MRSLAPFDIQSHLTSVQFEGALRPSLSHPETSGANLTSMTKRDSTSFMSNPKSDLPETSPEPKKEVTSPVHSEQHHSHSMWVRIREATGTVYGDIGTSVLYTVMEITRETIRLKNHNLPEEQLSALI